MKKIAIYGAGGFGREVACLINLINEKTPQWDLVGFFDDGIAKGSRNEYSVVLGGMNELNSYPEKLSIVLAIANPKIAVKIIENINSPLIDYPNLISPDLIHLDEQSFKIGKGNIIGLGCRISCNVTVGDFNILNGTIVIGHDTVIGNFNAVMPAVKISGEVIIGNRNFLGVNSVVLQQIKIGDDTVVGASSLIIRKTKNGKTYVGNPATIINL